jgi:hypothetical protein
MNNARTYCGTSAAGVKKGTERVLNGLHLMVHRGATRAAQE